MTADPFAALGELEGVPSAMAAARAAVDSVLHDLRRQRGAAATTRSLLAGAHASAHLAGGGDDLEQRARRLSAHLLGLLPVWRSAPIQALARMHTVVSAGTTEHPGRPASAAGVARLRALAESVRQPTGAPGMVVAAVVHAEVYAAAAFPTDNGLLARAAERLVLSDTGVDPASVTVPEAGHLRQAGSYPAALEVYAEGSAGIRRWLLHAAAAYAAGAEEAADLR